MGSADCLSRRTECPSKGDVTILNAESEFLPVLSSLSLRFPKLRICLEHLTTAAAVETVEKLGKRVAGTITAHHLCKALSGVVSSCSDLLLESRDVLQGQLAHLSILPPSRPPDISDYSTLI